jgi:outer membrane protein assembly factor BamB
MESSANQRTFQVRNAWARQTTEKPNEGFRKINRFAPLMYHSPKHGDLVIAANAIDGIVAYSRDDGQLIWRLPVTNGVESSAVVKSNYLFFGGLDGQFYSVDAESGQVLWTFPARMETLSDPTVADGVVYFLTGANSLYALEADSGKQLWLYTRPETSSLSIRGGSKPAYQDGTVFVGFSDGAIVALNAKNGTVKWEKQLSRNKRFRDLDSDPLMDHEFIYVLGYDDAAYALRSANGDLVWRFDKGGYGGMAMAGDRLYFATTTDEFVSVDRSTGRQVWAMHLDNGIATSPTFLKGLLVFGESQGNLHFVESGTGREVGHFEPGRGIFSPPTVDEKSNRVYFISNEGNLYGIEAKWARPSSFSYLR